ncbi:MAG: acyltransferase [Sideroxydans sp.]|nr:acyltransferase [Sideroxydans sp.]
MDYAKALGIILVVYGHVARGLKNAGFNFPINIFTLADSIVYSFHMPLFFFLSGLFFCRSLSNRGARGLLLDKVDTIFYPYLLWSFLQGAVEVSLSNYTNGNISFGEVLHFWSPRAQFWFLYALFLVFTVATAIYCVISERLTMAIFILVSLLYVISSEFPNLGALGLVCQNLVFFIFGVAFKKYNLSDRFSSSSSLFMVAIAFIVGQYIFHGYLAKVYTDKGFESLFLACISIILVVSVSVAMSKKPNRFIAFIGASSMAIYVMHILAGSGARIFLSKILSVDSLSIHLVVGCFAGVLLPLLALKIISAAKIPYVFSAPVSKWIEVLYGKILRTTNR